jgi:hypothetical protein
VGNVRESVLEKKSFLVQQFLENAAEVKGEQPLSLPAGSETPPVKISVNAKFGGHTPNPLRKKEKKRIQ